MNRANDRKYMAQELDIDVSQINKLKPLDYIERDVYKSVTIKGRLGINKIVTVCD